MRNNMQGFRFKAPFHVKDRTIYDADGQVVRLWGVNYYAPFNHNFYNLEELGIRQEEAVDRDIAHFKLMGIDLVRMHMYEREITDPMGNIVENRNMEVFDYLIDACEKNGIFLMLSPISYWNTVANQLAQEKLYAYWYIHSQRAFGFTNFFSVDAMIWDQDALDAQVRYMNALFSRKNRYSGKTLSEYKNIVVFELCNEPVYPNKSLTVEEDPEQEISQITAPASHGPLRKKFIALWQEFRKNHSSEVDEDKCFALFRAEIMDHYFKTLWPIVDKYFGKNVLHAQFTSYSGILPEGLDEVFAKAPIDLVTIGSYLNSGFGFDAVNTDQVNHLPIAQKWFNRFALRAPSPHPVISYEFDATGTTNGYPLAAIAAKYLEHNIQIGSYFTYTPFDVTPWNPGWLVHFFNIAGTPSRAAAFAISGEFFRRTQGKLSLEELPEEWKSETLQIKKENDLVVFLSEEFFGYSNDTDIQINSPEKLCRIVGRKSSDFASSTGNGCYFMEKIAENQWRLTLFPDQKFLADVTRGRAYRTMANRYVNCLKEPPVVQLQYNKVDFTLKMLSITECRNEKGDPVEVRNNTLSLLPGTYTLYTEKEG
ncbi:MAG: hypothetical protein E7048_08170 [Lentisphaerae bacterium]|nr:hypothetical protein [Lentisphaerota bacterium]